MKTITADYLRSLDACSSQVELFEETFPDGATVNLRNARKALRVGLDLAWLSELLPATARKAYDEAMATASKAYNEASAPASKAYNEAMATAWEAYDEASATARKAYNEAMATASKAYDEAMAPASKAYNEASAPALVEALGLV